MKSKRIRIWTRAYRPFICGGDVHAPISTMVDGTPVDLGRGFSGYVVKSPDHGVFIVEAKSGGIVGNSLAGVRTDIRSASVTVMRKQVREAVVAGKKSTAVETDEFWTMVRKARP